MKLYLTLFIVAVITFVAFAYDKGKVLQCDPGCGYLCPGCQ